MAIFRFLLLAFVAFAGLSSSTTYAQEENPLAPVRTDSPRDTMRTFMTAMNTYREGLSSGNLSKMGQLDRAVRTLDLSKVPQVNQDERGRLAAVLLKEVIDRVIVINYNLIPNDDSTEAPNRWRLKGTEIAIVRVAEGERTGEFLFSPTTVTRARHFYDLVQHLPYKKGSGMGALYEQPFVERYIPVWLRGKSLGLFNWQWIGVIIAIFVGYIIKWLVENLVALTKRIAARSKGEWDDQIIDAIEPPVGLIAATAFWFLSIKMLQFQEFAYDLLTVVTQTVFSLAVIWLFLRISDVFRIYLLRWAGRSDFPLDDQLVPLIYRATRLTIVVIGVLITIQNLGVNVMSLVAGLGLGGLAFALAAKDTAANLFGSIMILSDAPFKVGDWIIADSSEGTVEEIGFRSTRIRTFYNSVVSIPNSVLANANIDNMGSRQYRRIKTVLGVTYDTPAEKLEAFLEGVKNIIKANPNTRKDYFHVVFNGFGPSSLDILLYCFLKVPDWSTELVEKQNLFLEILRLAESLGVSFAFPTQSLHVEAMPGHPLSANEFDLEQLKASAKGFGPEGQYAKPGGLGIYTPPFREST